MGWLDRPDGLALLGVGIPLWAVGASDQSPSTTDEEASQAHVQVGLGRVDVIGSF